ncbi:MAG: TonB-dependent receptor [Xanthomonadales bacterium]|nr:TonB-dependent receptor [Xanthomonadales bacterium]
MAQSNTNNNEAGAPEEIIVTATRRETTVQEIPYNISALDGDDLEAALIDTNADLVRSIAGASLVDRGHRNAGVINSVMIRGLNVESSAFGDYALSTVPTVSTYVNDTPIFANFIIKDLERVEVLRGPQGTLYGSGSLGGTIRYITKRPQLDEVSGDFDLRYSTTDGSSGNNLSGDVVLNFPLGDTAAVRIVAGMIDNDGIVDGRNLYVLDSQGLPAAPDGVAQPTDQYEYVKDLDTVDIDYYRISALFEPSDTFSALFTHQSQEDDIGGRRHATVGMDGWGESYDDYQIGSIQREPSSREVDMTNLEMNFDLGFATLTSSTSVYDHSGDSVSENTGFYAQLHWLEFYYYNYPRPMASAIRTYEEDAFVQELRLVSEGGESIDWILGGYYMDQDQVATQMSQLYGWQRYFDEVWGDCYCVDDNDFRYNRDENFKEKAIFGELTFNISDTFRLTTGFRYFDNDYDNITNIGVGLWDEGIFRTDDTPTFAGGHSDTLFKLNASWDLADNRLFYATWSEGFRRGGANAVPLSGIWANDPVWQRYDPDSVDNYEIGLKGSTDNLSYTASLFYVDWENIQLNDASTNGGFFAAINGGDASTKGLELELIGQVGDDLNWNLGYAFVNAELDSDLFKPDDFDMSNPIAFSGDRLPGTSEHTLNFGISKWCELSNGRSLVTRVNGYYQSDTENHINRDVRFAENISGFSIWDASLSLVDDRWSLTLYAKNLFNEEGVTGMFKNEYMGTDPSQNYFGNGSKQFLSLPRTIGLAVSYGF